MTKAQAKRRATYIRKLRACGFRSWKRANERRGNLIDRKIEGRATPEELSELANLQELCDLYLKYKTNDSLGRMNRKLDRTIARLESSLKSTSS